MSNRLEYWLSFAGGDAIRFPVHPESITVESPFGFEDVHVTHLGEYSVFGERPLKSIKFSAFFPGEYNSSYCEYSEIQSPSSYVSQIESWRDKKKPLRLVVAGTGVNIAVTVREFSLDYERAGAIGDVYFTLSLKEYRHQGARESIDVSTTPTASMVKAAQRPPVVNKAINSGAKTYTVKAGDSLTKVFEKDWQKVYEANKKIIGANPNIIVAGQKLVIPI